MTDKPLAGKVALVTGASRGIGAATAIALAAAGAHVVLVARTSGGLEETEEAVYRAGGTATIAPLDIADGEAVSRLAGAIAQRWGVLDILVLNAAMLGSLASVPAIDAKEFSKVLTTNVGAPQAMIAVFDPWLRKSKDARVIAVTTTPAREPRPYWGAYAASKAALEVLVQSYGEEVKNISAIRTHIVNPHATRTAMRAKAFPGEDPATVKGPEVVADAIVKLVCEDTPTGSYHSVK